MKLLALIHRHHRRTSLIEVALLFGGMIITLISRAQGIQLLGLALATIGLVLLAADLLYDQWLQIQHLNDPDLADLLEARTRLRHELAEIEARIEERSP